MQNTRDRLDHALWVAHGAGDKRALAALYAQAAEHAAQEDARGFYLTQAYVFALDCGADSAAALHARLTSMGREE